MGGLEDGPGRLLPQHVAGGAAASPGRGGLDAVGGVGLAVAELGERQRRRRAREARDVGGGVAQQRGLVERVRRVHRPQQLGGQLRHRRRRRRQRQRQRAGGAVGRWAEEGEETATSAAAWEDEDLF